MHQKTVVHPLSCPASHEVELVELRLTRLSVLQLAAPEIVSCSQREEASDCGRCLTDQSR